MKITNTLNEDVETVSVNRTSVQFKILFVDDSSSNKKSSDLFDLLTHYQKAHTNTVVEYCNKTSLVADYSQFDDCVHLIIINSNLLQLNEINEWVRKTLLQSAHTVDFFVVVSGADKNNDLSQVNAGKVNSGEVNVGKIIFQSEITESIFITLIEESLTKKKLEKELADQSVTLQKLTENVEKIYTALDLESFYQSMMEAMRIMFNDSGYGVIARALPWQIESDLSTWSITDVVNTNLNAPSYGSYETRLGEVLPESTVTLLEECLSDNGVCLSENLAAVVLNKDKNSNLPSILVLFHCERAPSILQQNLFLNFSKTVHYKYHFMIEHERLNHLAYYDINLNIPNRHWMIRHLSQLDQDTKENHFLMVMTIDDYDQMGADLGIEFSIHLYTAVFRVLKSIFGDDAPTAKLATGELVLIIKKNAFENTQNKNPVENFSIEMSGVEHQLSATTSLISLQELDKYSPNMLIHIGEALIARAREYKAHSLSFSNEIRNNVTSKNQLLIALRDATKSKKIEIALQPKVELTTGKAVAVESLARWRLDSGEFVDPKEFIWVAEAAGIIDVLGALVLEKTLAAGKTIHNKGFKIPIAYNISAKQIMPEASFEKINEIIDNSNFDRNFLELEITETELIKDYSLVENRLRALMATGISVSVDDFGTGVSSISNIYRLPAKNLKIDKTFIASLSNKEVGRPVVEVILRLGTRYDYAVFAEGIETEEQRDSLIGMNCLYGQGFLFAEPMSLDNLLVWLKHNREY